MTIGSHGGRQRVTPAMLSRSNGRRALLRTILLAPALGWLHADASVPAAWQRRPLQPRFQLTQLDDVPWRLDAQRGSPLLLNFWASWCGPCRDELPALAQLSAKYQAQGLKVMAVNFRESGAQVQRFMQTNALQLTVLRDADGSAAKMLGIHIFPTTLAIDRSGRVSWWVEGDCDWAAENMVGAIANLLSI